MTGREDSKRNDLFYLCSLIEYVARMTKNERQAVVDALGTEGLQHYYTLADVYHCENIEKVATELAEHYGIATGSYDNVAKARYAVPTYWDMGKVMLRLVLEAAKESGRHVLEALQEVYHSVIIKKIDDYNCSMYYENTGYQYASLKAGEAV